MFLHNYTNGIWSLEVLEGLSLSILVTFPCQIFLIMFQRILNQTINLTSSQLPPFQNTPPLLEATYSKQSVVGMENFLHPICANLMSFKFSLHLIYLCTFSNHGMFINKGSHNFDFEPTIFHVAYVLFFSSSLFFQFLTS